MTSKRHFLRAAASASLAPVLRAAAPLSAALAPALSSAQSASGYPGKAVRIVVPYPAGGGTDTIARIISGKLNEAWGQPMVVENRAGAAGVIGNEAVAKAAPDGYTLLVGITTLVQAPHLGQKLPYDVFKDFTPISQLALSADLFVVPASSPVNSLKEFVEYARARQGKVNCGSYGQGTSSHVHCEMLSSQAKLGLVHVPFKGGAPLLTDLIGGQLDSGFVDVTSARAHVKSGKLKILAITGDRRFKALPNVATFTELGYKDFEPYGWFGALGPANLPADIVSKLGTEIAKIIHLPEVQTRIEEMGLQAVGSTPAEFTASIKRDYPIWGKVIKEANIRLD